MVVVAVQAFRKWQAVMLPGNQGQAHHSTVHLHERWAEARYLGATRDMRKCAMQISLQQVDVWQQHAWSAEQQSDQSLLDPVPGAVCDVLMQVGVSRPGLQARVESRSVKGVSVLLVGAAGRCSAMSAI